MTQNLAAACRQSSLFTALEEHNFLRFQEEHQPSRKKTGRRRRDDGETLIRGGKMGYCGHHDCGGCRRVWKFKRVMVCERHWRQRRRINEIAEALATRAAS